MDNFWQILGGTLVVFAFLYSAGKRKPQSKAPKQWRGDLIEVDLMPANGFQAERAKAAQGTEAKVVWVKLRRSGGDKSNLKIVCVKTRDVIGELSHGSIESVEGLNAALDSGTNGGTCFVAEDYGLWNARLRLGEHRYMPKPYWK